MVDVGTRIKFTEYIRNKMIAVISTVSSTGQPESATIYFDFDEDFHFYFMTKNFSRKYINLQHNPQVSLVIGTENEPATVQVQGKAEEIKNPEEMSIRLGKLKNRFFENTYVAPLFQLSSDKNTVVVYKITPSWIRWLDLREPNQNSSFIQIL